MSTTHETLDSQASSPNVPIFDSNEVAALKAELAAAREAAAAAEARLETSSRIPHGMAMPESAEDYVLADDTSFPQLDAYNSPQVAMEARRAGKLSYLKSRITHQNFAPRMEGAFNSMVPSTTFWMYDEGGYARRVPRQSVSSAMAAGLYPTCPRCQGWHKDSETNPNACPSNNKVAFTVCRICKSAGFYRPIYDTQVSVGENDPEPDPHGAVQINIDVPSTAEARLKVRLEQHIRAYHKATAASMGLKDFD